MSSEYDALLLTDSNSSTNTPEGSFSNKHKLDSTESRKIKTRDYKKIVHTGFIFLAEFLSLSAYTLIGPFFPEVAVQRGLTQTVIGVIYGSFEISKFLTCPLFGVLIGIVRPKLMAVLGTFLCGGCCFVMGFMDRVEGYGSFVGLCILIRLVEGTGCAMLHVSATSILLAWYPKSTGKITSIQEMFVGIPYIVGPMIGAALHQIGGYELPFMALGGATICSSILLCLVTPNIDQVERHTKNFFQLLRQPGLVFVFIHTAAVMTMNTFNFPVLTVWATKTYNITSSEASVFFMLNSISYAIGCPIIGVLVQKGYRFSMVIFGYFAYFLLLLMYGPSPLILGFFDGKHYYGLYAAIIGLAGFIQTFTYVPSFQIAIDSALLYGYEPCLITYGLVSGLIWSAYSLGSIAGPFLSGYITEEVGYGWTSTIMSFLSLTMGVVTSLYVLTHKLIGKPLKPKSVNTEEENSY